LAPNIEEIEMTIDEFASDLEELHTAEDFLEYFRVPFEPRVVQVNRLHILQRFHDYLAQQGALPETAEARWALHADLLARAYQDFVDSDALTEKVFRVFHLHEPKPVRVSVDDLMGQVPNAARV
jgi:nitrogenase-stabilizing/protective protein